MGATQRNVFVAHYNLDEKKADAVSAQLQKRLPNGKPLKLGVPGAKSFSASVDGAERAFVRPKPGVLATVPASDAREITSLLKTADVPDAVRPGELLRLSWPNARRTPMRLPRAIKALRVWIVAKPNGELVLAGEGDCADASTAEAAVDETRSLLMRAAPRIARLIFRSLLGEAALWADGRTVRYEAHLDAPLLEGLASLACPDARDPCAK